MYVRHFGLNQSPFSIAPDPRFLYMSQRHREALAHLLYGLQAGGGFVLLTGDIGSGKTTVCRSLLQQTPAQVQLAYVFNPRLDGVELLQTICEEFRIPLPTPATSLKALVAALNAFLLQAHASGQRCVLIIDEAQNLRTEVLEQLRLLTNLETHEHKLLQIILIGQPELRQMLERPELEQLAQRVIARYHLQALGEADTRQYILHRLQVAGLQGAAPFTPGALRRVHTLSRGVPRRINLLCDRALLGAWARRQHQVDTALVNLAAAEVLGRPPGRAWAAAAAWSLGLLALTAAATTAWVLGSRAPGDSFTALQTPAGPALPAAAAPHTASPTVPRPAPATPNTAAKAPPSSAPVPALTALPDEQNLAWQALGQRWGLQLPGHDVCPAALAAGVQCFRTSGLTVAGLQQLDRPGLLLLHRDGASRWVQAHALQGSQLVLQAGASRWTLPLTELPGQWRGDYATLWRLPPGQSTRLWAATPQDPAGRWLNAQLARLSPPVDPAQDFTARVRAFQRQHGLHGDGKALPSTFLLVNRLAGVDEPRLQTAPSPGDTPR